MPSQNIEMLELVALGLGYLKEKMVFVGGAVAELYASSPELSEIRPTLDIDCTIELSSRVTHAKLEEELRTLGFTNDVSKGAPICRWKFQGILVDVMPSDAALLGFSNRWYRLGITNKISKKLPNGLDIYIFSAAYYLATKFEAHFDRGGNDLRQSHDFEDIIYVLDNCQSLMTDIAYADAEVKAYLKTVCSNLLQMNSLLEGIESAMPYGSTEAATAQILERLRQLSNLV